MFCAIVSGDEAAHLVADEAGFVAFLDRRPLFPGHTLVVPRGHHETLTDLPADTLGAYFAGVQAVAGVVETALGAGGTFVSMNNRVSQSVPHLHAHVVPRTKGDGLKGFFWPRTRYLDDAHMAAVALTLSAAFQARQ